MMRHAIPIVLFLASPVAAQQSETISWSTITAEDGSLIGHIERRAAIDPAGRTIVTQQTMSFREEGASITRISERTTLREDRNGDVISIRRDTQNRGGPTETEVTVRDGQAIAVQNGSGGTHSRRIALPRDIRFDGGAGLARTWNPDTTPRLTFSVLNLDTLGIETVVIEPAAGQEQREGAFDALRRTYDGDMLVGIARLTIEPGRGPIAVTQPMFGTRVTIAEATQAAATRSHSPYRVLAHAMQKSPFRIPDSALNGHIRYRFAFQDGIAFAVPQTGEQRVTPSVGAVTVDICGDCGPGLASDPETLAEARRATPWLQSDNPLLIRAVASIAERDISDTRKMELLAARTMGYLPRIDFSGHYSALDTMDRRAGDCTEAAVLLAAFGRAAGIPTKVVNGLVYSRPSYHGTSNAFLPHSWTLAYVDGAWRSFDAALYGFDTTHIALTIGDGDARSLVSAGQLASLLIWQDIAEVRTRRP